MEHHAQVLSAPQGAPAFAHAVDVLTTNNHVAARRMVDARDHVEQCGLPAPGLADNGDELAVVEFQIDGLQGGELARRVLIDLIHVFQHNGALVGAMAGA